MSIVTISTGSIPATCLLKLTPWAKAYVNFTFGHLLSNSSPESFYLTNSLVGGHYPNPRQYCIFQYFSHWQIPWTNDGVSVGVKLNIMFWSFAIQHLNRCPIWRGYQMRQDNSNPIMKTEEGAVGRRYSPFHPWRPGGASDWSYVVLWHPWPWMYGHKFSWS